MPTNTPNFTEHPLVREGFRFTDRSAPTSVSSGRVHLFIRYATEPDGVDEVLAVLTDHTQAQLLLETYERLEASGSGYDVVSLPVHTSAAAVLGL